LITIQDDADISHAISLSSLLKLTVNGIVAPLSTVERNELLARIESSEGVATNTYWYYLLVKTTTTIAIDKVTHPVVVPMENLAPKLSGLNEKQTVAAVTVALIDLQDKIAKALQVIQSQHPTAHYPSDNNSSALGGSGQNKANGVQSTIQDGPRVVDSKPLVLTAESLGR